MLVTSKWSIAWKHQHNGQIRRKECPEHRYHHVPGLRSAKITASSQRRGSGLPGSIRYSTLDEEMVSRLDALTARKQAQDRFHPPAVFEHEVAHANVIRQQQANPISSRPSASSSSSGPSSPQLDFPGSYDYKPISNPAPISIDGYPPAGDSSPEVSSKFQNMLSICQRC